MWLDDSKPGDSWMGVWFGSSHCGKCHAIMHSSPFLALREHDR
jgi:hypothetical protein